MKGLRIAVNMVLGIFALCACRPNETLGPLVSPTPASQPSSSATRSGGNPVPEQPLSYPGGTGTPGLISSTSAVSTKEVTRALTPAKLPIAESTDIATIVPSPGGVTQTTFLKGPLVALRLLDVENYLLLFDAGTMSFREIRKEVLDHPFEIQWFNNGCQLYISGRLIDLYGNTRWEIPSLDWQGLLGEDGWSAGTTFLSPNKERLAYQIWSGHQTYDSAELVDLGIANLTESGTAVFLTENGGAKGVAWSPDGQWLAFSGFDNSGILQVYRATPDGHTIQQLTFHAEQLSEINYLVWSPDGRHIAYAVTNLLRASFPYEYHEDDEGSVGLVSVDDLQTRQVTPDKFGYVFKNAVWWSEDSSRIAFSGRGLPISDTLLSGNQIHWADSSTGVILDSYFESDAPGSSFGFAAPVGSLDEFLIGSGEGLCLFDARDRTHEFVTKLESEIGIIQDVASGPAGFPGEVNCQNDSNDSDS